MKPHSRASAESDAPSHKYRIEIPNSVDDMGLTPFEIALYVHVKRRAGDAGVCNESTRELAAACRMSVGQVSAAKRELKRRGLIGTRQVKRQDVLFVSDIWQKNYETFAPHAAERSPGEQSVHTVNTSFTTRTHRSPGEHIVHTVNVPPDPLNRREEPEEEPSEEPTQELSLSASGGDGPEKERDVGSSWKTKFSLEQVKACARSKGLGDGWVTVALETGKHDWQVAEFLNPSLPLPPTPVPPDPKQCPDCEGRGYYFPDPRKPQTAPCRHPKLVEAKAHSPPPAA